MRCLYIVGIDHKDGQFEWQSGYVVDRADPPNPVPDPGSSVSFAAEAVDGDGQVLSHRELAFTTLCSSNAGAESEAKSDHFVEGMLPIPPETRQVRALRNGTVVQIRTAPAGEPAVELLWEPRSLENPQVVRWKGSHPEGLLLQYTLLFSSDGGRSWLPQSLSSGATDATVDLARLPGGPACQFAVDGTDGFHTVRAFSRPFELPLNTCQAMILSPLDGGTFHEREVIVFAGNGWYLEEGRPETSHLIWESSMDGEIGRGSLVSLDNLSPGEHVVTLAAGSPGREGRSSVNLVVGSTGL